MLVSIELVSLQNRKIRCVKFSCLVPATVGSFAFIQKRITNIIIPFLTSSCLRLMKGSSRTAGISQALKTN